MEHKKLTSIYRILPLILPGEGEPCSSAEDEEESLWETGGEHCAQSLVDTYMFYMCGTFISLRKHRAL